MPLASLDAEAYRILLGQQVAVEIVLPRALDVLAADPLAEGDLYPGDLLTAALARSEFWTVHPDQRARMARITRSVNRDRLDSVPDAALLALIDGFRAAD